MEHTMRVLIAFGLTLLLVLLRLDAERFGTAEYADRDRGARALRRQLAWYGLGIAGVLLIVRIHPQAGIDLRLTGGDPLGAVVLGFVLAGAGAAQAVGIAWNHYHRLRLPDLAAYPAALANEVGTAFLDEAVFRGALLGFLTAFGTDGLLAVALQAIAYTLATRIARPGHDRYLLLVTLAIGLVGGWVTLLTGGIGAAFLGHAVTRVAIFLTTGHAGQPAPAGTEWEDVARRRRAPDGWSAVGAERPER
jgi:membrane protease YdiL (CAAX protease family)